jgi:replication factor C subunit 3/5
MELTLENSLIHLELFEKLTKIDIYSLINYLFIGPKSCGKRTLIKMLISNIINNHENIIPPKQIKTTLNSYQVKVNNNTIDIEYRSSNYHYELNIYEYGLYDKIVLSEFVKMIGETQNISNIPYKILVLYGFDKTNKLAQLALRRMIETYSSNIRIFLVGSSHSKIDKAILSRFKTIYIGFPKKEELVSLIKSITLEANPDDILEKSGNDLNRIIFLSKLSSKKIEIINYYPDYNEIITNRLLYYIFNEKWTKIGEVREFLLNIVLLNINLSEVLKDFAIKLMGKIDNSKVYEVLEILSEIDRVASILTWNVFCIEYFLLKIKSILNVSIPNV